MGSRRTFKGPGTAAAGGGSGSSGTAALLTTAESTATPRFMGTATAAARSSASPTTRPTSHADHLSCSRRAFDRPHRHLVALRFLDGGDDRALGGRRQAANDDRLLHRVRAGRGFGRHRDLRALVSGGRAPAWGRRTSRISGRRGDRDRRGRGGSAGYSDRAAYPA